MWSVFVYKTLSRKILILKENILQKSGAVEEILTKNASIKTVTSGNIAILKTFMNTGISKAPMNSYTKHLFVFNLFDKKNNYERIRF